LLQTILIGMGLFVVVAFLLRWRRRRELQSETWIEAAALGHRLSQAEDLLVVDVRSPEEFNDALGHIPGARNIPLDEIEKRAAELEPRSQSSLVLVCKTDRRSAAAARLLRARGFVDVSVLRAGMEGWNREGLATASETPPGPSTGSKVSGQVALRSSGEG
jgi:rhodanese-related sulfurtransferase